jgi:hypothetical protein
VPSFGIPQVEIHYSAPSSLLGAVDGGRSGA